MREGKWNWQELVQGLIDKRAADVDFFRAQDVDLPASWRALTDEERAAGVVRGRARMLQARRKRAAGLHRHSARSYQLQLAPGSARAATGR